MPPAGPGTLDGISRAIGELQGQVAEIIRAYNRTEARIEQMTRDLTREISDTRDSWHRRANESQALLGKIDLELYQVHEQYKACLERGGKLEDRITDIEKARRRSRGEIRLSAATIGTLAAGIVEGAIHLWKFLHGGMD